MNTRSLLIPVFMLISVLLSACVPAAPTALPMIVTPTIVVPTARLPAITPTPELTAFKSKVFELPMTVSFGSDWHVSDDFTDLVTLESSQQDWSVSFNIVTSAQLADPADGHLIPFPEDFAAWIQADPDFNVDQPTQVMVAGINGIQMDATPVWKSTTTNKKPFLTLRLSGWNIVTKPERWRFILLDNVHGEPLLILLIARADHFDDAAEQVQTILDGVVFGRLTFAK